jgi:DNA-binding transcriptional LysR family regulator
MAQRLRAVAPADNSPLDWTSLRDFLAVAETGSLSRAARRLGVSQPTLTRRMAALEERFRTELFRRTARGVELTEAGESLLEPARQMDQEAHAAEIAVSGRDTALAGAVRVTATENLGIHWLTPELAAFQAANPAIEIDVLIQNEAVNLLRREADIALRLGRPRQPDLVGRKLAVLAFGLYASQAYLDRHGRPARQEDLQSHRAVVFDEARQDRGYAPWLEPLLSAGSVAYRTNSLQAQLAAMRAGYGIGAASRFIAERRAGLERVLPELETSLDVWLVTHSGLRRSARIRAVVDFLAQRLSAARAAFAGQPG